MSKAAQERVVIILGVGPRGAQHRDDVHGGGASVVLAGARGQEMLDEVAAEVAAKGGGRRRAYGGDGHDQGSRLQAGSSTRRQKRLDGSRAGCSPTNTTTAS